jgi:hypothetical protein
MKKVVFAMAICVFTVGAFACGGGNKDKEEEKRFTSISRPY